MAEVQGLRALRIIQMNCSNGKKRPFNVSRELTTKCPIGDEMHNWAFQIGDWGLMIGERGLENMLE